MSTPTKHALLSASSAHRWMACTAAPVFEAQFPAGETSVYAEEGTLAHEICEVTARHAFKLIDDPAHDTQIEQLQQHELYSPEMLGTADAYAQYLLTKAVGFTAQPFVTFEQRVDFSRWVPEGFGTCDCIMVGDGRLHITDYKHGKGVAVSAVGNPQMRLYALGALQMFSMVYDINTVSMAIVQPRIHEDVEEDEISVKDLLDWAEDVVKPLATRAYEGRGRYIPGDHCRFCRGRAVCRARADAATAMEDFSSAALNTLRDTEIGDLLTRGKILTAWYEDLQAHAQRTLLQGGSIPGYKLVEGRSARAFDDTDAAFDQLAAAGYDPTMLYDLKPKTLTELEKMVGKKRFAEIVGGHIIKPAGKPTLAPESDKRLAFSPAEADFKGVVVQP